MAWDCTYNILWTQRVDSEEKAFLAANEKGVQELEEKEKPSRSSRRHLRTSGSTLSQAGASSVHRSPKSSGSRAGSERSVSTNMSRAASEGALGRALAELPEHMAPLGRFPVVDRDLMSARTRKMADGLTPTIRFKKEVVPVTWGSGSIIQYKPEFILEERPEWLPEDLLKERPGKSKRRMNKSSSSSAV
jgi:hypothetical protein